MKLLQKIGAVAGIALAVTLAGCGGKAPSAQTGSGQALAEYQLVKEGVLTVGTAAEYEPFEYVDNGEYKGFDLDLIKLVAEKLDLKVQIENVDFDTIVPGVASGAKYDVGIAAITVTPDRKKQIDFTDTYYMDDQAIVTMKDNAEITADNYTEKINTPSMKIAVQSGSTAEAFAKENFPNAELVPFKNATDCFSALQAAQVGSLVTNRSVAAQMVASTFDNEQVIKQVSTGEDYAIAVGKGNAKLKEDINRVLNELEQDGSIDALMERYNIK
ncbi:ABC transporter substrate-binding protein [Collinsella sp. AGMB00827]|uniref:ABC transporter substrate-binding protein n=1 Tax=Collinsella ureilytica TaxID=2869515 RepID=A0ABS7MLR8_9ACTN|nr:ABC transporter substrate-binding protein [Collinsella urealyticum]MBY4798309.1 ABC transporter substrate-binding protein [Collinsella urealyticum]